MSSNIKTPEQKYLDFTGFDTYIISERNISIPNKLIYIGEAYEIPYASDKWDNKRKFYVHRLENFGKMYITPDGKTIIITDLNLKIKPEGLTG